MTDEYDSPWKDIIENYFPEFLMFFFPAIHTAVDWRREPVFMDQELQKLWSEHAEGKRYVDKLVRVFLKEGREVIILIHIDVQIDKDLDFASRMFVYNYRIYDKTQIEVISLAILGDDDRDWRPDSFAYGRFGSKTSITFPIVKLRDFEEGVEKLEESDNPFAMATLAHLASRQTKSDRSHRYQWKMSLIRQLVGKGWDRDRINRLMDFMDYVLKLPIDLDKKIQDTLHSELGGEKMRYINSFERIGMAKGQVKILTHQLTSKFGELPSWAEQRLESADENQIMSWATDVMTKDSLEAVLADHPS